MPRTWNSLITFLSDITRKNHEAMICCTHCGNRYTYVRWGFYNRYLFNDESIRIQRYRCDNDLCPQKTFSILPHAFLPIVRASLCMLMYVLSMYERGQSIADIAKHTGSNWPRDTTVDKKSYFDPELAPAGVLRHLALFFTGYPVDLLHPKFFLGFLPESNPIKSHQHKTNIL